MGWVAGASLEGRRIAAADGGVMGKSKVAKVAALVELDPKKVLKMEPDDRVSWFSEVCRLATDGIVQASQLYNVLSNEKFADGLSDKAEKRMHRTMLKNLSGLAKLPKQDEAEARRQERLQKEREERERLEKE
eukprot:Skav203608  [mRNA]  locus=scaffold935:402359:413193:+ [translate_table: standard]